MKRGSVLQFTFEFQQVWEWLEQFNKWLNDIAMQYGYLGLFFVSVIGASSIIIPIPYTLIIFFMGMSKKFDPLLLTISAGTGSAVGEFFGYILGYCGRAAVSEERKRKMNYILKIFSRYGAVTIFLFALLPLPDDLLFIPLGIMHYSFLKAFLPCLLGKLLMSLILSFSGYLSIGFIESIFGGDGGLWTIIATTILLIVIVVLMFKVDWEKVFPLEERAKNTPKP
ncbi:MAG: VTT domain-containing protein [Candidatus Bathyarchaeia archaeon]